MKQDNSEIAALKVIDKSLFLNQDQDYQDLDSLPPLATVATVKPSMKLWHRRLGHLSYENVQKTASLTQGMHVDGMSVPLFAFCRSCTLGQSIRTVSRTPQTRASWNFETIHVDVIRPITPTGFNGSKWSLVITDDYSQCR